MNLVSVILPVYNAGNYLQNAVQSILNQTYKNFELIIINDGSTDGCCDFLMKLKDNRIKLINHNENKGIIDSLNEAIMMSKGEFIVRMDADDISYSNRIQILLTYMNSNPQVGIAGSYTNQTGKTLYYTKHLSSDELKVRLLFDNVYSHPTMIFRKSIFSKSNIMYNKNYIHAEDYGLWIDLLKITEYGMVPVPLLKYGIHHQQISKIHRKEQIETVGKIHRKLFEKMNIPINEAVAELHKKIFFKNYDLSIEFLKETEHWLLELRKYNDASGFFDRLNFYKVTSWVWFEVSTHLASRGICNFKIFRNSTLYNPLVYNKSLLFKYRFKSFFCI